MFTHHANVCLSNQFFHADNPTFVLDGILTSILLYKPYVCRLNPHFFGQQLPFVPSEINSAFRRFCNWSMFDGQMERIPVFSCLICIFGRVNPVYWLVKPPVSRLHHNKKNLMKLRCFSSQSLHASWFQSLHIQASI